MSEVNPADFLRKLTEQLGETLKGVDALTIEDALADLAEGRLERGAFHLVERLLTQWTFDQPPPGATKLQWGVWTTKSLLLTAGHIAAYKRRSVVGRTRNVDSLLTEYLALEDVSLLFEGNPAASLLANRIQHLPFRDEQLIGSAANSAGRGSTTAPPGEDEDIRLRFLTLPSGREAVLPWQRVKGQSPRFELMACRASPAKEMEAEVGDAAWAGSTALHLMVANDRERFSTATNLSFADIGTPNDYVDDPKQPILGRLTRRVKAYMAKGRGYRVLLTGAMGNGKSTVAHLLASKVESGRMLRVNSESFSERSALPIILALRPRVLLVDDMDRAQNRASNMLHLLEDFRQQHESTQEMVIVLTANTTRKTDPALLRQGRIDEIVEFEDPTDVHRLEIVRHYLKKFGMDLDAEELSTQMGTLSGAEIYAVIEAIDTLGAESAVEEIERVQAHKKYIFENTKDFEGHEWTNQALDQRWGTDQEIDLGDLAALVRAENAPATPTGILNPRKGINLTG